MQQISKKYAIFTTLWCAILCNCVLSFVAYSDTLGVISDSAKAEKCYNSAVRLFENGQFDSSISYYEESASLWMGLSSWKNYVRCKIGISENYIRKRDVGTALKVLNDIEKFAQHELEPECEEFGRIYTLIGYINSVNENYDLAIENTLKGISVYKKTLGNENEKIASAYYTLGVAQYGKGEYEKAIDAFNNSKLIYIKLNYGDDYKVVSNYIMLGKVHDAKSEFDQAIEYYQQTLKMLADAGKLNTIEAATCHIYLTTSLNAKAEYYKAIEHGIKAIEIYSTLLLGNHLNVAASYFNLGEIYTTLGDFDKAKEYLEHALQIFFSQYPEKKSAIGALHQRLGEVYKQTGNLSAAVTYSLQGIALLEQSFGELHPEIGSMYEQLAGIYAEQKNITDALKYYRKAIAARENVGKTTSRSDIAALYSAIADVYIKQGTAKLDSAFVYLNLATETFASSSQKNIPQEALLLKRYGDAYLANKNYHRALEKYQSSIALLSGEGNIDVTVLPSFEKSIYKKELLDVVLQKAITFEKRSGGNNLSDLKTALYHYEQATELVDAMRKQFSYDGSKFFLAEKSASVYASACRIALQLNNITKDERYKEKAFLIADRSKANVLLEKLFDGEAKQFAGIPDSLLQQEKELLREIAFNEATQQKEENNSAANTVQATLFNLKTKHQQLVELFEREYPKYYELKYARYSITLKDVQEKLDENSAIVEYLADESTLYAFLITKNNLTVATLPAAAKIDAQIEKLTSSLRKYDGDGYVKAGKELYAALLKPLASSFTSAASLIIIPDGNLYYVPFEALLYPSSTLRSTKVDFTTLPYLVTKYDISYSYSAAFYCKMYGEQQTSAASFAGFAPVFRDSTNNGDFLANRAYVEESGMTDVRSITLDGKKFNELKYSEDEVLSIGNEFNHRLLPYRNFLHTSATESNFKQYASTYDIIHVATHGFINESNPKLSAILFSQPLTPDAQDDGILHVNETFNLDLNARLVVLSSCESGLGKLVKGEGMIALTRGLFYAGAKNIIYSLWKVSDKHTYQLMDEFYKQMLSGKSYSSSLRAAKLKMIGSKESAFPSKWSGFVLVGE